MRTAAIRILSVFSALLLAAASLSGCSGLTGRIQPYFGNGSIENDKAIRFAWWGREPLHSKTVAALQAFQNKNPGFKVEPEYSGWDGYFEKILTQLSAGNGPDLMQLSYTNTVEYVLRNQLLPLDPYIEKDILNIKDIDNELTEPYRVDGSYYGVPNGINTGALYFNKEIFDRFGIKYPTNEWTWDDYLSTAEKLTADIDGDGKKDIWGSADLVNDAGVDIGFDRLIYDRGGRLWNDKLTKAVFNNPEGLEVFRLYKEMADKEIVPPPSLTATNPSNTDNFQMERVAMVIHNTVRAPIYEINCRFDFGIVNMPADKNERTIWLQPTALYCVNKNSAKPDMTIKLLDFLVNDPEAGKIFEFSRGLPANQKIRSSQCTGLSEHNEAIFEIIETIKENPKGIVRESFPPGYMDIYRIIKSEKDAMLFGEKTPENALKDAEDGANSVLDKFYSLY